MTPLAPVLITPPATKPVDVVQLKAAARIDAPDEDIYLDTLIATAVGYLDGPNGILGRCIVTQVWAQSFSGFPTDDTIRLPLPDVTAATVTYRDAANAAQTLSSSAWQLAADARGAFLRLVPPAVWPVTFDRPDAVTVQMTAGYGAAPSVPAPLRTAICIMAATMDQNREGQALISPAVEALIASYRVRLF